MTLTYQLSKHLASILSPLQNNKYTVRNSHDFTIKVSSHTVDEDECLASFDVVALFTSVPTTLAIDIVKNRLNSDVDLKKRSNLSIENIVKLLDFVLNNNYFVLNNIYRVYQKKVPPISQAWLEFECLIIMVNPRIRKIESEILICMP